MAKRYEINRYSTQTEIQQSLYRAIHYANADTLRGSLSYLGQKCRERGLGVLFKVGNKIMDWETWEIMKWHKYQDLSKEEQAEVDKCER